MHELGLLEKFLACRTARSAPPIWRFGDQHFTIGDFTRLPTICKFIALMPQWDFLDFLAGEAKAFPNFHLLMETEADDLLHRK